jgi:hypothetical protein
VLTAPPVESPDILTLPSFAPPPPPSTHPCCSLPSTTLPYPLAPAPALQVAIALGLGLAQQLTGTEAILYYTPRILNQCVSASERAAAHITDEEAASCISIDVVFLVSLGVGFSKLLGEFVAAAVRAIRQEGAGAP